MSNLSQELIELQQEVDEAQKKADRAQGAYEQVMKQIKDEFACDSLEKAENALKKLKAKEIKAKEEFEEELDAFRTKWEDILDTI